MGNEPVWDAKAPRIDKLISDERQARERLICEEQQIHELSPDKSKPSPAAHQAWWHAIADLLSEVATRKLCELSETQDVQIRQVLLNLEKTARHLQRGIEPGWISGAVSPHAPPRRPGEEQDIRTAVRFIRCADAKAIRSRKARATVAKLYKVAPSTIRRWLREYDEPPVPTRHLRYNLKIAGNRFASNATRTWDGAAARGRKARARKKPAGAI